MIISVFNIEDYKGDFVMHCKTEEEAKDFCRYLDALTRNGAVDIVMPNLMNGLNLKKILVTTLIYLNSEI